MEFKEILLIHLGGLGDCCLSESVFHSVSRHYGAPVVGLGTKRFLSLFEGYFTRVHGIESARWLYLFSSKPADITWERIVFIGKDREGSLRERWQRFSRAPLVFIDMYPEGAFGVGANGAAHARTHVEDHQLAQLPPYAIEPKKLRPAARPSARVILYPEKGFKKEKWPEGHFVELYHALKSEGVDAYLLEPMDLDLDVPQKVRLQELAEVRAFLEGGGIFVSNDSGMAHFAGMLGLFTVTVFSGFDPLVWHPRGGYRALVRGSDRVDVSALREIILERLAVQCAAQGSVPVE